jgi:hypothetical protein
MLMNGWAQLNLHHHHHHHVTNQAIASMPSSSICIKYLGGVAGVQWHGMRHATMRICASADVLQGVQDHQEITLITLTTLVLLSKSLLNY